MDRISLRGLRVVGVHGILPEEKERAQPFELDIDVDADLAAAAASDDLADTLDYGRIATTAAGIVATESFHLLERLAARIADAIVAAEPSATRVTVTVWKLRPPVPVQLERAGVTVTRP